MSIDQLTDYILPIGLFILYFFLSSRRKEKRGSQDREEMLEGEKISSRKASTTSSSRLESSQWTPLKEQLEVSTEIKMGEFSTLNSSCGSPIGSERVHMLLSESMQKYTQDELKQENAVLKRPSRASQLVRKRSLRQAVLIHEILNRPFD